MLISYTDLESVNRVQTDILKNVDSVCKELGITCYMVHGSLLGTVRNGKFVSGDDDIDIAMMREDYDKFLSQAPALLEDYYFIQHNRSEKCYPLDFAKIRDSRTTYIIDIAKNLDMNHGIYIDLFPIDNAAAGGFAGKAEKFLMRLCYLRTSKIYDIVDESFGKKLIRNLSVIAVPSFRGAISLREKLLRHRKQGRNVQITGGKPSERSIPREWFEGGKRMPFEGISVTVPAGFDGYLRRIYGNYTERTLIENKEKTDDSVDINACTVDVGRPYTEYCKKRQ